MKFSLLRGTGLQKDIIFDINSPYNRDNCFAPYVMLKEAFDRNSIQINTSDLADGHPISFELHQDVQHVSVTVDSYLLLFETRFIKPDNGDHTQFERYRKIFTWDDRLVDGDRFIKINFPNKLHIHGVDGFSARSQFCCLISSNRALSKQDDRDLYIERVAAIRWFEKNAPANFDLYGIDWNFPAAKGGTRGRLERRLWLLLSRFTNLQSFPSYRGRVDSKHDVLSNTRFSICYENVRDLPGYITEKIFDCFFAGCVPVYWGASNVEKYIPADCFIDRRQFSTMSELYAFLEAMSETEFMGYQQRISDFLSSDAAHPFGANSFAETIVKTVVDDLGI